MLDDFTSENYDDWFNTGWTGGGGWGGLDFAPTTGGGSGGGGGFELPDIGITIGGGGTGGSGAPSQNQSLTQIVNYYEAQLKGNLGAFQSSQISADTAIARGWTLMDAMVSACLRFGANGQKSAAERDRRIAPNQLRWDWIAYYIDPITGGNTILPPVPGGGINTSNSLVGGNNQFLLIGGLLLLLLLLKDR